MGTSATDNDLVGSQTAAVIPYATPATRAARFGLLKALPPLLLGAFLGWVPVAAVRTAAPDFIAERQWDGEAAFSFAIIVFVFVGSMASYSTVVLLLIGAFTRRTRIARSWLTCALIGFSISALMATTVIVHVICVVTPSPRWVMWLATGLVFLIAGTAIMIAPFLFSRRHDDLPSHSRVRRRLIGFAVILLLGSTLLALGKRAAEREFETNCAALVAWVKSTEPGPGSYPMIDLPPSFRNLSPHGYVDAIILPDGRVLLMLKTTGDFETKAWSGIIYASAPLTPTEFGKDRLGRVQITGFDDTFVVKQVDPRHFIIGFD